MRLTRAGRIWAAALIVGSFLSAGAVLSRSVATAAPGPATSVSAASWPHIVSSAAPNPAGSGYWDVYQDGTVAPEDGTVSYGDESGKPLNAPMIGIAPTSDGRGYWLLGADGGIFTFGNAVFHGSTGAYHLNAPAVGMATDPATGGYWLVASDGGIFSFDAPFYGSTGSFRLNQPVVGMAATPDGKGYWLVAKDGGIFSFGNAGFHGSTGSYHLNAPIVGMARTPDGKGYWLLGADGGVFTFGDAHFYGSDPGIGVATPATGIVANSDGGYTVILDNGSVNAFSSSSPQPVPVTTCVATGPGPGPTPSTARLPAGIALPPGASVYGIGQYERPDATFAIGPAGATCYVIVGGDSSFSFAITDPSGTGVDYLFNSGGASPDADSDCQWLPVPQLNPGACTARPTPGTVTLVATGDPSYLAATINIPAGATDTGIVFPYATTGVVIGASNGAQAQEATCTLPAVQRAICKTAFDLFVTETYAAASDPGIVARLDAAIAAAP